MATNWTPIRRIAVLAVGYPCGDWLTPTQADVLLGAVAGAAPTR